VCGLFFQWVLKEKANQQSQSIGKKGAIEHITRIGEQARGKLQSGGFASGKTS
jgi:hypothetical protein